MTPALADRVEAHWTGSLANTAGTILRCLADHALESQALAAFTLAELAAGIGADIEHQDQRAELRNALALLRLDVVGRGRAARYRLPGAYGFAELPSGTGQRMQVAP